MELDRSRLTQERWFCLIRWLFIEAFLFHSYLTSDLSRALDAPLGGLLAAFTVYTLAVTLMVVLRRRTWPVGLAYTTATIDTIFAVLFVSGDAIGVLSPALVGVAAASVGVGVRRFPIFETFTYSFIIAVGIVAARLFYYRELTVDFPAVIVVSALAVLPVLARAVTLAPQEGARDDPASRLLSKGLNALGGLAADKPDPRHLHHAVAETLARYTDAHFAGILARNADDSFQLYSTVDGATMTDRLPVQPAENLAARMIAVYEPTVWSRRDNLHTRGLPDQYPQRLDSVLIVPVPNLSDHGAVLFAANRKGGGFRPDDRIIAVLLGREAARLLLAHQVSHEEAATRSAATEALLAAIEAKRPGSRNQAEECARLAVAIAQEMGWSDEAVEELRMASLLHDVGELAIPDPILDKPEPLEPGEFDVVREHPRNATRIIDYFNHSPIVLNAVYGHHERWDGRGYPSGLDGEAISMEARILSLADSVESMLSPKAFRPALSATDALQEIVKASGTQFDPSVVQAFLGVLQREGPTFLERPGAPVLAAAPDWGRQRVG